MVVVVEELAIVSTAAKPFEPAAGIGLSSLGSCEIDVLMDLVAVVFVVELMDLEALMLAEVMVVVE